VEHPSCADLQRGLRPTFLVGPAAADGLAGRLDIAFPVPFAAGNCIYIAATDLLPQVTTQEGTLDKTIHTTCFVGD
jgi:zinc and cadmium transporter